MDIKDIIKNLKEVMKNSYSPYSKYKVGAVLVCKNGKMYTGCNVENHGIMSICAERVAFTKAISEGEKEFDYIVICGGYDIDNLEECLPCGYCRQFISEFVNSDFKVYTVDKEENVKEYKIVVLLPYSFKI